MGLNLANQVIVRRKSLKLCNLKSLTLGMIRFRTHGILVAVSILLLCSTQVHARDYQPHMLYYDGWWGVFGGYKDSLTSALDEAKVDFEAQYPGATVTGFYPYLSGLTFNGIPHLHNMNYNYNGYSEWTNAAATSYECAVGLSPRYTSPTVDSLIVWCSDDAPVIEHSTDDCNSISVGKPIYPSMGFEQVTEAIYQPNYSNYLSLDFNLTYRSDLRSWRNNYLISGIDFTTIEQTLSTQNISWPNGSCYTGIGDFTGRAVCLKHKNTLDSNGLPLANDFAVIRGHNRMLNFGTISDLAPRTPDINDRVTKITVANGSTVGWLVYNANEDSSERYDLTGRIISKTFRNGVITTFVYSSNLTPAYIAPQAGLLNGAENAVGASLKFTYNSLSQITSMTNSQGGVYNYKL